MTTETNQLVIDPADIDSLCAAIASGVTTPALLAEWDALLDAWECAELVEDCLVLEPGYRADDGNAEVHYPDADDHEEAAQQYVDTGDWGDDGEPVSIDVYVWRDGIDADGEIVRVDGKHVTAEKEPDHEVLIAEAVGGKRYLSDICGGDPDDHDWTSDGEGGLRENPGCWSTGGTTMVFASHCRQCGLHRTETRPGRQRNPGACDTVTYRMLDDDEIASHRENGDMDEAEDQDDTE